MSANERKGNATQTAPQECTPFNVNPGRAALGNYRSGSHLSVPMVVGRVPLLGSSDQPGCGHADSGLAAQLRDSFSEDD